MAGKSCYLVKTIADLHMHSTFSDGRFDIENIISKCISSKLEYFCISDHDTVSHIPIIQKYIDVNNFSINFIPGTEFTCEYNNCSIHILGYGFDYNSDILIDLLKKINNERYDVIEKMGDKLINFGCNINYDHILEQNSPGRPHLAKELINKGYAKTFDDVFDKWLGKDRPGYVKKWKPSANQVINLIHDANGYAFIAHMGIYKSIKNIEELVELNLDGVEVYHPRHSISYSNNLIEFCRSNNLIYSGGSDYHGWEKGDNYIGSFGLTQTSFDQFYKKCLK